jgi:hypothetical protein
MNTVLFLNECVCKDGYYMDGGICMPCGFKCNTCENDARHCRDCADSRTNAPACDECPYGLFDDDLHVEC